MGKIAFVFPGQGTQYSGMGLDLFRGSPAACKIFHLADQIRPGTSSQCFSGSDEDLAQTHIAQPCLFAVELAAAAAAVEAGISPSAVAGFSLGEIAALTFSGAVSFEEGFKMVCLRGELMRDDAEKCDASMVAVLKLDASTVEHLCSLYKYVYPVNYNCPGQISVSGERAELEDFIKSVKAAGGRAVPLRVCGGFHSPFMASAAVRFGEALKDVCFCSPKIPLYSNYTASLYADDFISSLSMQICSPVRWQDIVTDMIQNGFDTFIELGPGKTLCGFIERTDSSVRVLNIEDCESLIRTLEEAARC